MKTELVTTFKRKATELLAEMRDSHEPVLITEHGKPSAVVMPVDTFQAIARRMAILEGIALGERAILDGQVLTHEQVENRLQKWLQ